MGSIGDEQAASDLYGTGVRLGFYFQVIGLLFSIPRRKADGIKMTCGGMMLAILVSWTLIASRGQFSPAEGLVILSTVGCLWIPVYCTLFCPETWKGEGFATICCCLALIWFYGLQFWFWATLYTQLPPLGTPGFTWFFARVYIDGWFRMLTLVSLSITLPLFMAGAVAVYALKSYRQAVQTAPESIEPSTNLVWRSFIVVINLCIFSLVVAQIEMGIKWNSLEPQDNFSQPGQSIPLIIGALTLLDGTLSLFVYGRGETEDSEGSRGSGGGIGEGRES